MRKKIEEYIVELDTEIDRCYLWLEEHLLFNNEEEAAEIIAKMWDIIDERDFVTVADVKKMLDIKVLPSDYHYGWTSKTLGECAIRRYRQDAYYIVLVIPEYREGLKEPEKTRYIRIAVDEDTYSDLVNGAETTHIVVKAEDVVESELISQDPDILSIAIHVNEIDVYDPDKIISSVFKEVSQIKDRTINITII